MNDSADEKEEWISGDYIAAVINDLAEAEAAISELDASGDLLPLRKGWERTTCHHRG